MTNQPFTETEIMTMQNRIESLHEMFASHLDENTRAHANMLSQLEKQSKDSEKLQNHIYGNGRAGVTEQLRVLERFADSTRKIIWLIVPAIILGVIATIWDFMIWHMSKG